MWIESPSVSRATAGKRFWQLCTKLKSLYAVPKSVLSETNPKVPLEESKSIATMELIVHLLPYLLPLLRELCLSSSQCKYHAQPVQKSENALS